MTFIPNRPTGHADVDMTLRDAEVFAGELQYVIEKRDAGEEVDLDYAHKLASRLCTKLRWLHEDLPKVVRMAADGRLDPPEDEEEGGGLG